MSTSQDGELVTHATFYHGLTNITRETMDALLEVLSYRSL